MAHAGMIKMLMDGWNMAKTAIGVYHGVKPAVDLLTDADEVVVEDVAPAVEAAVGEAPAAEVPAEEAPKEEAPKEDVFIPSQVDKRRQGPSKAEMYAKNGFPKHKMSDTQRLAAYKWGKLKTQLDEMEEETFADVVAHPEAYSEEQKRKMHKGWLESRKRFEDVDFPKGNPNLIHPNDWNAEDDMERSRLEKVRNEAAQSVKDKVETEKIWKTDYQSNQHVYGDDFMSFNEWKEKVDRFEKGQLREPSESSDDDDY
jgi:hypothetical protein